MFAWPIYPPQREVEPEVFLEPLTSWDWVFIVAFIGVFMVVLGGMLWELDLKPRWREWRVAKEMMKKAEQNSVDGRTRGANPFIFKDNPTSREPDKVIAICHGCGQRAYACPEGCKMSPCDHGFFGVLSHPIGCGPEEWFSEPKDPSEVKVDSQKVAAYVPEEDPMIAQSFAIMRSQGVNPYKRLNRLTSSKTPVALRVDERRMSIGTDAW